LKENQQVPRLCSQSCQHLQATFVPDLDQAGAMMEYKGYVGQVTYDDEAGVFLGEVINTRDAITFQGTSVKELRKAFHDSIEEYLAFCQQRGEQPEKPFSGQFVTRISPELHRRISLAASLAGESLNAWVAEKLENGVQQIAAKPRANRPKQRAKSDKK
jgi:predicted HicB family RNase H-like nuclease